MEFKYNRYPLSSPSPPLFFFLINLKSDIESNISLLDRPTKGSIAILNNSFLVAYEGATHIMQYNLSGTILNIYKYEEKEKKLHIFCLKLYICYKKSNNILYNYIYIIWKYKLTFHCADNSSAVFGPTFSKIQFIAVDFEGKVFVHDESQKDIFVLSSKGISFKT